METLDKHFRELTKAAFARHGFAQAEVIGRWAEIAGEQFSLVCRPERIKWPRGAGETAQKTGGTLVVRAAAGQALALQYEIPLIIERLNRFLGYGAITAVKIVQDGSWRPAGNVPAVNSKPHIIASHRLAAIADDGLRSALERLAAGVAKASQGSPQGK